MYTVRIALAVANHVLPYPCGVVCPEPEREGSAKEARFWNYITTFSTHVLEQLLINGAVSY